MKQGDPVLITTKHRGVFFGYLDGDISTLPGSVTLTKCRNCVYWDTGTKGFLGLAAQGPSSKCRIGPAVDRVTLYDVTSVATVHDDAVCSWEGAPWSS